MSDDGMQHQELRGHGQRIMLLNTGRELAVRRANPAAT
jgi:hypothetical protein